MFHSKNKVNAFTLSEMVVVLIVSSIVVGLAYMVLNLVQKQMVAIRANLDYSTEIEQLEASLKIDFMKHPDINYDKTEERIILKHARDSNSYYFQGNRIFSAIDTFKIRIIKKEFYFNGEPVDAGKIDAIKLTCGPEVQNHNIFVFKVNSANNFMD